MKRRITVLDSRPHAKHIWPFHGKLYCPLTGGQCCVGQNGRQNFGVPLRDMVGFDLPKVGVHPYGWVSAWEVWVPRDILLQIRDIIGDTDKAVHPNTPRLTASTLAARINDVTARRDVEVAVKALRVLWRWVGETQGERWIIQYYPAKPEPRPVNHSTVPEGYSFA